MSTKDDGLKIIPCDGKNALGWKGMRTGSRHNDPGAQSGGTRPSDAKLMREMEMASVYPQSERDDLGE